MRIILLLCLFVPLIGLSQQDVHQENPYQYEEKMDDPYVPVDRAQQERSKPYFFQNEIITTVQVNVDADGNNLIGDAANEPSISVNPIEPNKMSIGWRQFETITSNFRQAGYAYTNDAGITWNNIGPLQPELFRSDPVLDSDSDGTLYYNSLQTTFDCDVFTFVNQESYERVTPAYGGDKQWMVVDRTQGESDGNIYAFWKSNLSVCEGGFTASYDGSMTYPYCEALALDITRGTMAVGPDGEVYACGSTPFDFYVLRSDSAKDSSTMTSWEQIVQVDLGGEHALYNGPNPNGMLGQVYVAADHSTADSRGNVYLLCGVETNNDLSEIMFSRSEDGGLTWSDAIKLNQDFIGNHNWFGTLSVAPNGRIDVVWLDTRGHSNNINELYYVYSYNGGLSWSDEIIIGESFDSHLGWPNQNKMGDYYDMISTEEGAHLAWAATYNGEQDIFYSFIEAQPDMTHVDKLEQIQKIQLSPNPVQDYLELTFSLSANANGYIEVFDLMGSRLEHQEVKLSKNQPIVRLDLSYLENGTYFLSACFDKLPCQTQKFIVIK